MYAPNRSCNADMQRGILDGTYKFGAPDRGGVVEDTTAKVRRQMSGIWHGLNEVKSKESPDGKTVNTIDYQDVASSEAGCDCMTGSK